MPRIVSQHVTQTLRHHTHSLPLPYHTHSHSAAQKPLSYHTHSNAPHRVSRPAPQIPLNVPCTVSHTTHSHNTPRKFPLDVPHSVLHTTYTLSCMPHTLSQHTPEIRLDVPHSVSQNTHTRVPHIYAHSRHTISQHATEIPLTHHAHSFTLHMLTCMPRALSYKSHLHQAHNLSLTYSTRAAHARPPPPSVP